MRQKTGRGCEPSIVQLVTMQQHIMHPPTTSPQPLQPIFSSSVSPLGRNAGRAAARWGHFLSSSTFDQVRQPLTGFPLGPSSPEGPLAPAGPAAPGGPASPFSPLSPLGPCGGARLVKIRVKCSGPDLSKVRGC